MTQGTELWVRPEQAHCNAALWYSHSLCLLSFWSDFILKIKHIIPLLYFFTLFLCYSPALFPPEKQPFQPTVGSNSYAANKKYLSFFLQNKRLEEEKLTRRCIYIDCFVHFPLKLTKTFKRPFHRWIKKSYMILDFTVLLLYIPTPPLFS